MDDANEFDPAADGERSGMDARAKRTCKRSWATPTLTIVAADGAEIGGGVVGDGLTAS